MVCQDGMHGVPGYSVIGPGAYLADSQDGMDQVA